METTPSTLSDVQRRYLTTGVPETTEDLAAFEALEAELLAELGLTPGDAQMMTVIRVETGRCWRCDPPRLSSIDRALIDAAREQRSSAVEVDIAARVDASIDLATRRLALLVDSEAARAYDPETIDHLRWAREEVWRRMDEAESGRA